MRYLTNHKQISMPGCTQVALKKWNEDRCYIGEDYGWVIDGASGLVDQNWTDGPTDAYWYVDFWQTYLLEHILLANSLEELLLEGMKKVQEAFLGFCPTFKANEEALSYPCAAIALFRREGQEISYYVLGDCEIIFLKKDATTEKVTDTRVSVLDDLVVQKMVTLSRENEMSVFDARALVQSQLQENRQKKNTQDGYWVLGMTTACIAHGVKGKIALKDITSLALLSDGFAQYRDPFEIVKTDAKMLQEMEEKTPDMLYQKLRDMQQQDADGCQYPRLKQSDDTTFIYARVTEGE